MDSIRQKESKWKWYYNLYIYFLHFALTFKFRKSVFTQEQTKSLCGLHTLPAPSYPIASYAGKAGFVVFFIFKKIEYLILLSVYLNV